MHHSNLMSLPNELLLSILEYLSYDELAKGPLLTNHRLHQLVMTRLNRCTPNEIEARHRFYMLNKDQHLKNIVQSSKQARNAKDKGQIGFLYFIALCNLLYYFADAENRNINNPTTKIALLTLSATLIGLIYCVNQIVKSLHASEKTDAELDRYSSLANQFYHSQKR